ncbi:MAG: hypothetical protein LBH40_01910 [Alphaproteobacteria bacterium]|jgi:hypothetical protein|nr:hypothetical protein [Alphaproteobacteria bacterium]
MFKIQYDLESFSQDLEDLKRDKRLKDWSFSFVQDGDEDLIELYLKDSEFGDVGFFEVKENTYYLEFRFYFYDNGESYNNKEHDEEVYSYFHGKLVRFILSKIIKNGESIDIIKG